MLLPLPHAHPHPFLPLVYRLGGWQPAEKPMFDVTHLHTRLKGNNVPMPDALIKTILRLAIPGLIQRKLLAVVPRELGSYLLEGGWPAVPVLPGSSACSLSWGLLAKLQASGYCGVRSAGGVHACLLFASDCICFFPCL